MSKIVEVVLCTNNALSLKEEEEEEERRVNIMWHIEYIGGGKYMKVYSSAAEFTDLLTRELKPSFKWGQKQVPFNF